ncbi:MAG TPA: hypothetical protein GYA07_11390 [Verrucomicrobia bacterium]|nr:hypothetical protein [Verrucomicrobiota bacterium]HOP98046.1 hypothetical protein [Verrucomicrobiota bacterium]HPU57018.1 hypothetical protein [Verrucomicrobiota bacterium]
MKNVLAGVWIVALCAMGCAKAPVQAPAGVAGSWSEIGTGAILRLGVDGIVQVVMGIETTTGTYSVDSATEMTLRFDGTAAGAQGPLKVKYVIVGDRMTLVWPDGNTTYYSRLPR